MRKLAQRDGRNRVAVAQAEPAPGFGRLDATRSRREVYKV